MTDDDDPFLPDGELESMAERVKNATPEQLGMTKEQFERAKKAARNIERPADE